MQIHSLYKTPFINNVSHSYEKRTPEKTNQVQNSPALTPYSVENLQAYNLSFKGLAPVIKKAYVLTSHGKDILLSKTKLRNSYYIDASSQSEIIYGKDAIKYLEQTNEHKYETQVIFPKYANGTFVIDGEEVKLSENAAVIITENTKAQFKGFKGYPVVVISKKDYDGYQRYTHKSNSPFIKEKFEDLITVNTHLYNGEFKPNLLLSGTLNAPSLPVSLKTIKSDAGTKLTYDMTQTEALLSLHNHQEIDELLHLINTLSENKIIEVCDNGYLKFCNFQTEELDKLALTNADKAKVLSLNKIMTQISDNCKLGQSANKNISDEAKIPVSGYDISGLKFINDNVAVYNLNDKFNNWTHGKTNWVTSSIAMSSSKGGSPYSGVSIVQMDDKKAELMSNIRTGECLHSHPNDGKNKQNEIYLITSGTAALQMVKDGKTYIRLLKEGDMAIVPSGLKHCVNSVLGEYEQVVVQVPSAFQYGYLFKQPAHPPAGYSKEIIDENAHKVLNRILKEGDTTISNDYIECDKIIGE